MTLPTAAATLAPTADANALRVLLVLAPNAALRTADSPKPIAELLGMTEREVCAALAFWQEKGVLAVEGLDLSVTAPAPERVVLRREEAPQYSGTELAAKLTADAGKLRHFIGECEQMLGKIFTQTETANLLALVDYAGMSEAYVLLVCQYVTERGKKGVGYAVKTAYNLWNEGVDDVPKLEAYLRGKKLQQTLEGKLRTLFGIGDRALTRREQNCISDWTTAAHPYELIVHAYEISVDRGKGAAFPYIDAILKRWRAEGYRTLLEVEAAEQAHKAESAPAQTSFDTANFFDLALGRSYEQLDRAPHND